jgi:coenzyme PQQ synthesis protein D (PqqD)
MDLIPWTLPRARRRSELVTRELAGELLIYDRNSNEAHCLNSTAALVWSNCDGQTTIAEMARLLEVEMKTPVADEIVWFALTQLEKSSLLQEPCARPLRANQTSRRALVKRLGIAAAVSVPLVSSIIAPTAAAAASCLPTNVLCTANSQCCSNNCADNGRGTFNCT